MYYANGIGLVSNTGIRTTGNTGGSDVSILRRKLWEAGFSSDEINDLTRQGLPAMRAALEDTGDTSGSGNTMTWVGVGIGGLVLAGLIYMAVKG